MLEGFCHCGAVRLTTPGPPAYGNRCQCSICRRYGVVWGYFPRVSVGIEGHAPDTAFYARRPGGLHFVRCGACGCVTHWEPAEGDAQGRIGINLNLFDPAAIRDVPVRTTAGPP